MSSDGFLFSHLNQHLITTSGEALKIEPVNKAVFLQENDKEYTFDDVLILNFPLHVQHGQIAMIDNRLTTLLEGNIKLLIEINLSYSYVAEYAPRYTLDVYKNNILYSSKRCGLSDEVDFANNLNVTIVIDCINSDLIELKLNKNIDENSVSSITILDNSFIIFKTF